MKPLIVRRVEDPLGRVVKEFAPVAVRRVIEPDTVELLGELLRGVVRDGTGRRAAVPGYVVAGKTGTAQKVDASGRYSMVDHVASFAGFVPASRPALVILVSLDTPRGPHNEGGDVAAPLFARIAEPALRRLAVPPDDPERLLRLADQAPVTRAAYTPAAVVSTVSADPARQGLATPASVEAVQPGAEGVEPSLMPDLRGQSAREAALAAARRGLVVELHGSGQVTDQSPAAGTEIEPGLTCVLTLGRPGEGTPAARPQAAEEAR
jgi:cell division protein FtsI (penicillin-binding protein 3)